MYHGRRFKSRRFYILRCNIGARLNLALGRHGYFAAKKSRRYQKEGLTILANDILTNDEKDKLIFHIVDSPMGVGKSETLMDCVRFNTCYWSDPSPLLARMRRNGWRGNYKGERYIIFVSTIKERDERFSETLDIKSPEKPPYIQSILPLIRNGENIVTTQSLWSLFNEETLAAFRHSDYIYTAYFDEIPPLFREVVGNGRKRDDFGEIVQFGSADVRLMQQENMVVAKGGVIQYNDACEYDRLGSDHKVFDAVKNLSRSCTLYAFGEKGGQFTSILAFARREMFTCFKACWFFSYRTWNSMLHKYCLLHDIGMKYYHILDRHIVKNPEGKYVETYPEGMERLVILDDRAFNFTGSLSKEWYKRARADASGALLKELKGRFRNAYGFMKQHGVTSDTFMFTTFTAFKELLQSNGRYYPSLKRFLPCNTKATNDYSDCTGVAYLCNRFFDVTCCNFLTQQAKVREMPELKFDNDNYALTELLQFIWRSNMRVTESGKPVYVWVPDQRMRQLLQDFQKRALEHKR